MSPMSADFEGGDITKRKISNFDIAQICRSGQCFRMEQISPFAYSVIAGDRCVEVCQQGQEVYFGCGEQEFDELWEAYFDLDCDYSYFIGQINPNDQYLTRAAKVGEGIRILRQDLWEMIVTFLISQQNNITRIRRCVHNICQAYGEERINRHGRLYYAFPRPEALAYLDEDALMSCNLGYRSKYVVRAARNIASGELDLEAVRAMGYKEAREELLKLYGVGEKVSECICLFALHHLQAFPIDTHINKILQEHYKRGFPNRRYKGFQGVMQQYIFYYDLERV